MELSWASFAKYLMPLVMAGYFCFLFAELFLNFVKDTVCPHYYEKRALKVPHAVASNVLSSSGNILWLCCNRVPNSYLCGAFPAVYLINRLIGVSLSAYCRIYGSTFTETEPAADSLDSIVANSQKKC